MKIKGLVEKQAEKEKRKCSNCGKEGSHFAPPSMGEPGFYTCKAKEEKQKEVIAETTYSHIKDGEIANPLEKQSEVPTVGEIAEIIHREELMPYPCEDSGQCEWTVGEAETLAKAIHDLITDKRKQ